MTLEYAPYRYLHEAQTYEVIRPQKKVSRQGNAYLAFKISDGEQLYTAHAWEGQYDGPLELEHGQRVHINGKWIEFNGEYILQCKTIAPTEAEPLAMDKARFRARVMLWTLPSHPLKFFVKQVFNDPQVLQAFVSVPASRHHHHGYQGGLFIHSVDAAWQVYRNPSLQGRGKSIAIVAALLHDIGKTRVYTAQGQSTPMGKMVDHDPMTLEILKPVLDWLDSQDHQMGIHLRHYLTWNPKKQAIPRCIGAAHVRMADQASAAAEMNRDWRP